MKVTENDTAHDTMRVGKVYKGLKEILDSNERDAQYFFFLI